LLVILEKYINDARSQERQNALVLLFAIIYSHYTKKVGISLGVKAAGV